MLNATAPPDLDADVITFEMKSSGAVDLDAVGEQIMNMKIGIGAIDHHTLQVESPAEVSDLGPRGARAHSGRTPRALFRLRHGPRRDEPPPRVLQDGVARPGDEVAADPHYSLIRS